jgi:hypothetical protein
MGELRCQIGEELMVLRWRWRMLLDLKMQPLRICLPYLINLKVALETRARQSAQLRTRMTT